MKKCRLCSADITDASTTMLCLACYRLEYGKKYRDKNKEQEAKRKAEWYQKNKERLDAKSRVIRKDNPERHRKAVRDYQKRNSVQSIEYQKEWRLKNKEYVTHARAHGVSVPEARKLLKEAERCQQKV